MDDRLAADMHSGLLTSYLAWFVLGLLGILYVMMGDR